jgi:hypothetical protein
VVLLLGDSDIFRKQKQQKIGGNIMKRPNRYPYTKSQWEEKTSTTYTPDGPVISKVYVNRLIGLEHDE